jgi:hypothetical protein
MRLNCSFSWRDSKDKILELHLNIHDGLVDLQIDEELMDEFNQVSGALIGPLFSDKQASQLN